MNIWIHTTIAATALAATVAVAVAGVSAYNGSEIGTKSDRLPVATDTVPSLRYVTIEKRGDGLSVLTRVPVTAVATN